MLAPVLLFVLAVIGVGETAYLNYKRMLKEKPICVIGQDCHVVLDSKYNNIFGIPNEIPGLIFFTEISLLAAFLVIELGPIIWWGMFIKLLILGGALLSLYFVYLQWRVIKAWCFWCVVSPVLVLAMVLVVFTGDLSMVESKKPSSHVLQDEGRRSEDINDELVPALRTSFLENNEVQEVATQPKSILLEVPFSSQAPSAQWDETIFQYACEETSILMAMRWVEGGTLTKEDAEREIVAIAEFEKETYGHFHDRSAADTAQLMKEYFDYQNVEYVTDIDASDIKRELLDGNVVIIPVNGQVLNNPFYTPPGPLEHMVVVIGYDGETHEFMIHDPGTKHGANIRYGEDVLNQALREYGTGYHEIVKEVNKVMIVVKPLS